MAFKLFSNYSDKQLKKNKVVVDKILSMEEKYKAMNDAELKACTNAFKERLSKGETLDDILPEAFAVCREASTRVLGMTHYPVQLMGGITLHNGDIAEMLTGEGKSLVATLPAYLNGLTGKPVHIVTVNDYLARRDYELNGKLFKWLGLSIGLIYSGQENGEKKEAYMCDIIYGTNNEFGFDYLRDNMAQTKNQQMQTGFHYAIIDEVDSVLIDEARTPLIISGKNDNDNKMYNAVDAFVKNLKYEKITEIDRNTSIDNNTDSDYVVDEKHKTASLTQNGIKKAEKAFKIKNLMDFENIELLHLIEQSMKAHGIMKIDVDYVVADNEVLIIDEFTGRIMKGRRFNGGLHQAIEAKEGVKVAGESTTLATVTFQNFFRMYNKISGMTGTASTEEDEFREIYGLRVVSIPTNKPNQRKDYEDCVYMSHDAKLKAIVNKIMECHEKGQPVLIGTTSVEKSEELAKMLTKKTRNFNVLNAKNHEKEAEIIANAGRFGAITISTNMAGRGTDIMLGGNPDYMAKIWLKNNKFCETLLKNKKIKNIDNAMVNELLAQADAHGETNDELILSVRQKFSELKEQYRQSTSKEAEKVKECGGLFVIGTERHESRRIDNQLRGRSARQGDPGETIFYLALDDDLLRIFGGEFVKNIMQNTSMTGEEVLHFKILSNRIKDSQKKIESLRFNQRKTVLRYDDVMNAQRVEIYNARQKVLDGQSLKEDIDTFYEDAVENMVVPYLGDTEENINYNGLKTKFCPWLCSENEINTCKTWKDVVSLIKEKGSKILQDKEELLGTEVMEDFRRFCLLKAVDMHWMEHIDNMERLKRGIGLRGYGQKDPAIAYRDEGFQLYELMNEKIQESCIEYLYRTQVIIERMPQQMKR